MAVAEELETNLTVAVRPIWVAVQALSIKPPPLTIYLDGGTVTLNAQVRPYNATNKKISWDNGKLVKIEKPDEIISYDQALPLDEELKYFVANLDQGFAVASGETGQKVVEVLEKVSQHICR